MWLLCAGLSNQSDSVRIRFAVKASRCDGIYTWLIIVRGFAR